MGYQPRNILDKVVRAEQISGVVRPLSLSQNDWQRASLSSKRHLQRSFPCSGGGHPLAHALVYGCSYNQSYVYRAKNKTGCKWAFQPGHDGEWIPFHVKYLQHAWERLHGTDSFGSVAPNLKTILKIKLS